MQITDKLYFIIFQKFFRKIIYLTMNSISKLQEVHFEVQWKHAENIPFIGPFYTYTPMMGYPYLHEEFVKKCDLSIYVQGKLPDGAGLFGIKNELVILTVHDMGTNPPNSFIQFVNSPSMEVFKGKLAPIFLHVCMPGQEPGAKEFVEHFPKMDELSQLLPQVLDHFGIKCCIAMGEGAGADVVYRFACTNPEMVSGVMLIHCTSSTHGFVQNLKEMIANLRIEEGKMSESAWDYLIAHKLGQKQNAQTKATFIEGIRQIGLNEHNLSQYLHAFAHREELHLELFDPLSFHCILVTGGKSPHNKNIFHMYENMDKKKTGLVVADGVVDVQKEAPEYIAMALTDLMQTTNLSNNSAEGRMNNNDAKLKNEQSIPKNEAADLQQQSPNENNNKATSLLAVPPKKPVLIIGCGTKNPATNNNNNSLLPNNNHISTSSHNSSSSNFQCRHCGRECRWCAETN